MIPQRRADDEPRCGKHLWCSLAGEHLGDCALIPQTGFQESFLLCDTDGALGGGAVGAGKSAILLLDALRHVEVPGFTGLILRAEQRDLEKADGLWHKSLQLYPHFGGQSNKSEYKFTFPSGATIQFSFIDPSRWEQQHQGSRACFLGFDELTHFTQEQVLYLISRNGTSCAIEPYWRATCNPDPDSWVRRWVDWWIADSNYEGPVIGHPELSGGPAGWPRADRAGKPQYYAQLGGQIVWGGSVDEVCERSGVEPEDVQSFTFLPGTLAENRFQNKRYKGKVRGEAQALRWLGNWNVGTKTGKLLRREWFCLPDGRVRPDRIVEAAPAGTAWCLAADLAATPESEAGTGGSTSYSALPLVGLSPAGDIYLADLDLGRWSAGIVEEVVLDAAQRARARYGDVRVHVCREHAGAGKAVEDRIVRVLVGFDCGGEPETGDKATRLRPFLAAAEHGHVYFVRPVQEDKERPGRSGRAAPDQSGDFVAPLLRHLLALRIDSDGKLSRPNDVPDALSAALRVLAGLGRRFGAQDLERVLKSNPGLATSDGSGPRTGVAPRSAGLGSGRFSAQSSAGRFRLK